VAQYGALVPGWRLDPGHHCRVLRAREDRLEQMNPVVAMAGASVVSVLVAGALVDPGTRLAVLLGMLGPLLAATSSWVLIERTYRENRQKLTNVMIAGFAFKLVFFGFYVG